MTEGVDAPALGRDLGYEVFPSDLGNLALGFVFKLFRQPFGNRVASSNLATAILPFGLVIRVPIIERLAHVTKHR